MELVRTSEEIVRGREEEGWLHAKREEDI